MMMRCIVTLSVATALLCLLALCSSRGQLTVGGTLRRSWHRDVVFDLEPRYLVSNERGLTSDTETENQKSDSDSSAALSPLSSPLICQISLYDFLYDQETLDSQERFMCSPVLDGSVSDLAYLIELDEIIRNEYETAFREGVETFVSITDAIVDETNGTIELQPTSTIELLTDLHRKRRRKLAESSGRLRALAVRIRLRDGEPSYTREELFKIHYQNRGSFRHQYRFCSAGKLLIEPTELGVLELNLNMYASRHSHHQIVNEATKAVLYLLRVHGYGDFKSIKEFADLVMFITPPMGAWLGYAAVGGAFSVYNDKFGVYLAAIMHETGHNFGLKHAHEGGEYQDFTGYMGAVVSANRDLTSYPAMCFNAVNHWDLDWFHDRITDVDIMKPTLVRVAAFTDYHKTTPGKHFVVVRSGNVYMHYNRASSYNRDTHEYRDHLTIYQKTRDGTYLFAAINYDTNYLFERRFSNGTWRAEICSEIISRDDSTPDHLVVSVGFGPSLCPLLYDRSPMAATRPPVRHRRKKRRRLSDPFPWELTR